jgi:hypothetical protein
LSESTNLGLPYLAQGQAQKHVTANESYCRLDALVQLAAMSATTAAQPASPADGEVYILLSGKTGAAWGGMAVGALAHYHDGVSEQITPREGFVAFVKDENLLCACDGASWITHNSVSSGVCEERLTLASATPFMASDVSAATSIYFTPYRGNQASIYDGAAWRPLAFTEKGVKVTDTQTGATTNGAPGVTASPIPRGSSSAWR